MAIECYYSQCKYHAANEMPPTEGPFCFEEDCRATKEQIKEYEKIRKEYLERMTV